MDGLLEGGDYQRVALILISVSVVCMVSVVCVVRGQRLFLARRLVEEKRYSNRIMKI